jgi:phosphohistidine swiveling domain-containing protein
VVFSCSMGGILDSKKTIPLEAVGDKDRYKVGAKAAGLARLMKAGFPVPPGFCINAYAYGEHLGRNGLLDFVKVTLDKLVSASMDGRGLLLAELREEIVHAPIQEELKESIEVSLRESGASMLAVRSSATAEDLPGRSFAGQYDTFLGVRGLQECLQAVKRCWASLWTERAFDYRQRNGFDHLDVDMAVVIQELVPAEAAGVIFTCDPVTGWKDRVTVEAVFGLGESLVSGKANPDRFVMDKEDLRLISSAVGRKTLERVVCEGGGVEEKEVDPGRAEMTSVDQDMVGRLVEMAVEAEACLGYPLDMEWAAKNGEVFLLQARPITTGEQERSWEDRQVWSNMNTGEVLPDVVTPMTWEMVEKLIKPIFDSVFARIGIDFGDNPLLGQMAGRAYFNLNTCVAAIRRFPFLREEDLSEILGGAQGNVDGLQELHIPEEDLPDLHFSLAKLILKIPGLIWWYASHSMGRGESFVTEIREKTKKRENLDMASRSELELLIDARWIMDDLCRSATAIIYATKGMGYYKKLDEVCRDWLGDRDGEYAGRLCSGLDGMDIAEAGFSLWKLALEANDNPEVGAMISCSEDYRACRQSISRAEGGRWFLEAWDVFMRDHGHHTRGELELFNPRWSERPDYILEMVRGYLRSMGSIDPLRKHRENAATSEMLAKSCRRRLRNPLKLAAFDFLLRQSQRGAVLRENIKSEAVRILALVRRMFLELGKRLAERDILESREDIFFLGLGEVESAIRNSSGSEIKELIGERRTEYEMNLDIIPPKVIIGRFDPDDFVAEDIDEDAEVLSGLAVSPGTASGTARVMLRSDNEQIQPGEVLVAPFTDPGWTPHFMSAAALIMDQGGLLSHGSIVAREYGIPAVVNVGPATRIIKTGQRVQVDGTRGIVRILR